MLTCSTMFTLTGDRQHGRSCVHLCVCIFKVYSARKLGAQIRSQKDLSKNFIRLTVLNIYIYIYIYILFLLTMKHVHVGF